MSSPPASPIRGDHSMPANSSVLAAAAIQRASQAPVQKPAAQLAAEHERRQTFRRLIDPGIIRPNSKEQAMSSVKTLLSVAENLLREPDNPKYKQFKSTNRIIQRELMNPKGAIEYAIEMGFRPEVKDFQPYYVFKPRYMENLRLGTTILRDHINLENEKAERAARARESEKSNARAAAERVKLAFLDDRLSKTMKDEMEKERRTARRAIGSRSPRSSLTPVPPSTLSGGPLTDHGQLCIDSEDSH